MVKTVCVRVIITEVPYWLTNFCAHNKLEDLDYRWDSEIFIWAFR